MTAKEFLAEKNIFGLDTKKRYNEVIEWMEEYSRKKSNDFAQDIKDYITFNIDMDVKIRAKIFDFIAKQKGVEI